MHGLQAGRVALRAGRERLQTGHVGLGACGYGFGASGCSLDYTRLQAASDRVAAPAGCVGAPRLGLGQHVLLLARQLGGRRVPPALGLRCDQLLVARLERRLRLEQLRGDRDLRAARRLRRLAARRLRGRERAHLGVEHGELRLALRQLDARVVLRGARALRLRRLLLLRVGVPLPQPRQLGLQPLHLRFRRRSRRAGGRRRRRATRQRQRARAARRGGCAAAAAAAAELLVHVALLHELLDLLLLRGARLAQRRHLAQRRGHRLAPYGSGWDHTGQAVPLAACACRVARCVRACVRAWLRACVRERACTFVRAVRECECMR